MSSIFRAVVLLLVLGSCATRYGDAPRNLDNACSILNERTSYLRAFRPEGAARHSLAVMATGGFANRLKSIVAPTLVIHGNKDRLVPLAGGMDSARAIPGASLHIIEGMGHDLPDSLCSHYADLIIANADKAQ